MAWAGHAFPAGGWLLRRLHLRRPVYRTRLVGTCHHADRRHHRVDGCCDGSGLRRPRLRHRLFHGHRHPDHDRHRVLDQQECRPAGACPGFAAHRQQRRVFRAVCFRHRPAEAVGAGRRAQKLGRGRQHSRCRRLHDRARGAHHFLSSLAHPEPADRGNPHRPADGADEPARAQFSPRRHALWPWHGAGHGRPRPLQAHQRRVRSCRRRPGAAALCRCREAPVPARRRGLSPRRRGVRHCRE